MNNGHFMIVEAKLTTFNNKLQIAKQLKQLSMERGNHASPILLYLEPPKSHQLLKQKSGKYNFGILDEEKHNK